MTATPQTDGGEDAAVARLLAGQGLAGRVRMTRLPGGANNRSFRVQAGTSVVLLKLYFHHPSDPRDRLGAEFAFSQVASGAGLSMLPRPLAQDPAHHLGLYEFVEGRKLIANEVTAAHVTQALEFFVAVNRLRALPAARALAPASEACFSLQAHLDCVGRRLQALQTQVPDDGSPVDRAAFALIRDQLGPVWQAAEANVGARAAALGLELDDELDAAERCLSPSDFGFHNALLRGDGRLGRLCFVDFEYAGWDDPAKTVCDFFAQPALPAPPTAAPAFIDGVVEAIAGDPGDTALRQRIALLRPVYALKWCCITLNEFLPGRREQRRFSLGTQELEQRKSQQIVKAQAFLRRAAD